jgi:hypothetical protein
MVFTGSKQIEMRVNADHSPIKKDAAMGEPE